MIKVVGEAQDLLLLTKEDGNAYPYYTLLRSFLLCKDVKHNNLFLSVTVIDNHFSDYKINASTTNWQMWENGKKFVNHLRETPCEFSFISIVFSILVR